MAYFKYMYIYIINTIISIESAAIAEYTDPEAKIWIHQQGMIQIRIV